MTKITEANCTTGEIIVRDATEDELLQKEADKVNAVELENAIIEVEQKLQTAKATAEAKLAAIGLTTDDLKALGL